MITSSLLGVTYGDFHKWGYPQMDGLWGNILLKWMIEGYPHLWKPPRSCFYRAESIVKSKRICMEDPVLCPRTEPVEHEHHFNCTLDVLDAVDACSLDPW